MIFLYLFAVKISCSAKLSLNIFYNIGANSGQSLNLNVEHGKKSKTAVIGNAETKMKCMLQIFSVDKCGCEEPRDLLMEITPFISFVFWK